MGCEAGQASAGKGRVPKGASQPQDSDEVTGLEWGSYLLTLQVGKLRLGKGTGLTPTLKTQPQDPLAHVGMSSKEHSQHFTVQPLFTWSKLHDHGWGRWTPQP